MEEHNYIYKALNDKLLTNPTEISLYLQNKFPVSDEKKLVHLCIYQVVSGYYNPFLSFLLQRNVSHNTNTSNLSFPSMPLTNSMMFDNEFFFENTVEYVELLLMTKFIYVDK